MFGRVVGIDAGCGADCTVAAFEGTLGVGGAHSSDNERASGTGREDRIRVFQSGCLICLDMCVGGD